MIAVKDMQMPKCCIHCQVFDGEYGICNIIGDEPEADLAKGRPEDCPLVEIITCKNCKHRWKIKDDYGYEGRTFCECTDQVVDDDGFCSKGERRR